MRNHTNSQYPATPRQRGGDRPPPVTGPDAGSGGPDGGGPRTPRRLPWALILATLAGTAFLVIGQLPGPAPAPVARMISALGEALAVAALLASLIERKWKRDLADEISHKTAARFFRDFLGGRYLPEPYYRGMRELAATDTLSLGIVWALYLEWVEPAEKSRYLRVTSTVHNTFTNTSSRSIRHGMTWLMYIRDGRPPSYLTRFELTVAADRRRPDGIGDVHQFIASEADLAEANDIIERGGSISEYAGETPEIPPAAQVVSCASGVTFHAPAGLMPLVCRYPTLSRRLTIDGPAVAALDIDVRNDVRRLDPIGRDPATGGLTYQVDTLAISGSTIRVQWTPRSVDDSAAVPTQATAVD